MARFAWLPSSSYLEFAVGVADLELERPIKGFSGPIGILGRLDLNSILPLVLGRLLGLQKVLRLARTGENEFGLRTFWGGQTVAFGSMNRFDHPVRASDCSELAPLIRTFNQPLASRSIFGTLVFTRFVWHWDQGLAQPVSCDLTIARGLGVGRYAIPEAPGTCHCTGAWQVRIPWTMEAFSDVSASREVTPHEPRGRARP
jgi:hypothetical protein